MKVLIDIDGVMVPAHSWKMPEIHADGFPLFSSQAVKALTRILQETNADLVLTSSHKSKYTPFQWREIFVSRGVPAVQVQTLPPNDAGITRKEELLNWLSSAGVEDFIIIDDDKSLNDLPSALKQRLILINGLIGLTDPQAEEAIALLRSNINRLSA